MIQHVDIPHLCRFLLRSRPWIEQNLAPAARQTNAARPHSKSASERSPASRWNCTQDLSMGQTPICYMSICYIICIMFYIYICGIWILYILCIPYGNHTPKHFLGRYGWIHRDIYVYMKCGLYIWVNYNISLTWKKAIWGWFPLLTTMWGPLDS